MKKIDLKRKCMERAKRIATLSLHSSYEEGAAYLQYKKEKENGSSNYIRTLKSLLGEKE